MQWIDYVGLFGAFLSSVTFVPQVYKAWQSRSILLDALYIDRQCEYLAILWHCKKRFGDHHCQLYHIILSHGAVVFQDFIQKIIFTF